MILGTADKVWFLCQRFHLSGKRVNQDLYWDTPFFARIELRFLAGRCFVKVPKTVAWVLGILGLVVCAELVREYTAPTRGRLAAHFDVRRGHYVVLTYGLPPEWRPQYAQLLQDRYGIEVRTVALCIVSETLRSYADSYDEVSVAAANHKFGHDVFKECAEVARQRIAVPEFSIAVKLSEIAQKKLQGIHESVLVIAYFDGDPLPGKGKDNSPMRGVVLGSDKKLVDPNSIAAFADTKISQSHWNDLADKDYYVTINVVSARKTSTDNLLDCDVPIARISTFVGKSTQVLCRLIGERDSLLN
jgi:hypothetical protein